MVVQLYKSTPTLQHLLGTANTASGGVSSITVPVQGTQMVNMQWTGYSGNFSQPASQRGLYDAEFNLKLAVVPIPFLGMEGIVQIDHAVVPIIEARMNDAMNVFREGLSTSILTNSADTTQIIGFPGAIDDSSGLDSYGGITRSTSTWWKAYQTAAGSVDLTRDLCMTYINALVKGCGEAPTMGITGYGTWTKLLTSLLPLERINYTSGGENAGNPKVAFRSVEVAGVPIYPDPYATEGTLYLINSNYMSLYIHKNGGFVFSGFQSTIPNYQIGFVGVVVFLAELVNKKCIASGKVTGLNYVSM